MSLSKSEVIAKLQQLGVSPKRSLGQNFLIGESAVSKILKQVQKLNSKSLIEVGPGLGALTFGLREITENLKLIEMDSVFAADLKSQGFEVFQEDALKMDWSQLQLEQACLVSNLPYQISSSLVIDRSVSPQGVEAMILMFQKEVAQRLRATEKTKTYGLLTVIAQSAWDIEFVTEAGPNEFYPPPNVASRVLKFTKNRKYPRDWKKYLQFVKVGFSHRRKYLLSNLNSVILSNGESKSQWADHLRSLGHSEKARAEELSVQDWIQLSSHLKE